MSEKTSLEIAEQILARFSESNNDGKSNLKLQKLLYYILGWTLAIEKRLLFNDPVEAQHFGPAFPTVWDKYRNNDTLNAAINNPVSIESSPLIDAVVNIYGAQAPHILVARTHREDPWMKNYCDDNPDVPAIIPTEDIEKYFSSQLTSNSVRLHSMFLGAYIDRKFEVVSVKAAAMSVEELQEVRREVGLA